MADERKQLQWHLKTLDNDMIKPAEYGLVVYPLPKTFEIEEKVIERMKLFGPMNVYSSSGSRHLTCICESAQTAKDALNQESFVVDGQTFYIVAYSSK